MAPPESYPDRSTCGSAPAIPHLFRTFEQLRCDLSLGYVRIYF